MSKTTKALAILGVVAGLGVAAMPMGAMAANTANQGKTITDQSGDDLDSTANQVADSVLVKTTIDPTLSITIVGSSDSEANEDSSDETDAKHLVLLGTSGKLANGQEDDGTATVTVATNAVGGYSLKMRGTSTGLVDSATNATIPAITAGDSFSKTSSGFGYKAVKTTGSGTVSLTNTWNPVSTTDVDIAKNTSSTDKTGDGYTITFHAYADDSQAAGTYSNTITLTAVAKLTANN